MASEKECQLLQAEKFYQEDVEEAERNSQRNMSKAESNKAYA